MDSPPVRPGPGRRPRFPRRLRSFETFLQRLGGHHPVQHAVGDYFGAGVWDVDEDAVAHPTEDVQRRVRKSEGVPDVSAQQVVRGTHDHERRRRQLTQLVAYLALTHRPPGVVEMTVCGRQGAIDSAGHLLFACLFGPCRSCKALADHRIARSLLTEPAGPLEQLIARLDPVGGDRRDKDEPVEAVRMIEAQPPSDAATHRVPNVREALQAQLRGERDHVVGVLLDRVAIRRPLAVACPSRIHEHAAEAVLQALGDRYPAIVRAREPVVKEDRLT